MLSLFDSQGCYGRNAEYHRKGCWRILLLHPLDRRALGEIDLAFVTIREIQLDTFAESFRRDIPILQLSQHFPIRPFLLP